MIPMEPIPESASVCPTCGQDLPKDVIQKNIENYEKKKQEYEDRYNADLKTFKEQKAKKIREIETAGTEAASCPVFIDNSEAVNEVNFPEMNAQMIHLAVTEDKKLKIESEDK